MTTTIGIALIVKNEEEAMRKLLPTLTPFVDQVVVVDTGSTDDTMNVARSLGAEVHEFPWTDNFSDARTFADEKLTTEWLGWCDADDAWENLELLRSLLDTVTTDPRNINALWLMYDYDQMEVDGELITTQQHRRERFVRRGTGWHWVRPVHEHQIADNPINLVDEKIVVHHRRDRSRDAGRNIRNIRILRKALRRDRKDARSWFDLGTQYHNGRRWMWSLMCYRNFLKYGGNNVEGYQAWHHAADAWRFLGNARHAEFCDLEALKLQPTWHDAWYGLAEIAFAKGDFTKSLTLVEMGLKGEKPIDFLVLNPLDYDYVPRIIQQRSLAATGRIEEALAIVEKLLPIIPGDPELQRAHDIYTLITKEAALAQEAMKIADSLPEEGHPNLFAALPGGVRRQKPIRDKLLRTMYSVKRTPDFLIWCGASLEDWGPASPETTGIGGSETAVIQIAKHLSDAGANVDVYNQCGAQEGTYGNTRYLDYTRFQEDCPAKIAVAWRNPGIGPFLKGDQRWLWLHDLHAGPGLTREMVSPFTMVRPVSDWHGWYLRQQYSFWDGKIVPTRNGIELDRFNGEPVERAPHRAIYCSAPDRGLIFLLQMWPMVRKFVSDAELHVFYGWETFDRTIQQTRDPNMVGFKNVVLQMLNQDGVIYRGRLPQGDLAREQRSAAVWAYPTSFLEVSCITAMEVMASGCVVLSTIAGALPETVGDGGLLLRGAPSSDAYQNIFTQYLIALMTKKDGWDTWSKRGLDRAPHFTWKSVAEEWLSHV